MEEEISLREYFFVLIKRLWLILLLTVMCIGASGIISFYVLKPEYQTFTTLMVGRPKDYQNTNQQLDYNEIMVNQQLVTTYGELVKSRVVADDVIRDLKLDIPFDEFKDKVNVNLVKDTEIIKIEVTDGDPELAAAIANKTAEVFMDKVKDIMNIENVQIIDRAQVTDKPVKPRPLLNMAIAGVLGLMAGIFLAFILEYFDNTIKTQEDVQKYLGLSVIGTIPKFDENN
ncbi:YveK family protein [Sporanaerobacter sp. PP17-6a]|uniref:YveK family protein n=1 Tax=Sporanaerobacter sp. PP17-6a TaxID=1891289 RepID=UPI0008A0191F|nr:Wzz/FepE/Etk N-terminal domain-containing protein [Sporanaerobacter sp. PP17-6a]SCL85334.1 Capsular polysaccharide type 8 biosynthesis protein cap8A [Sporanaerobacter sp. PP17-6a]